MVKQRLFIPMLLLLLSGVSCKEAEDWSRSEYLLAAKDAQEEGEYNLLYSCPSAGTYSLYVSANVDYDIKFETGTTEKDWLTLEGKQHDAASGKDVIRFTVKEMPGAPAKRSGTISLMAKDIYLSNFITVSQGFSPRVGSDFTFLKYGSANPLEGIAGRAIAAWNEEQIAEGWQSTVGTGQTEAYCYGRNGFVQLGDDAGHGADLVSPYNSDVRRDTVLLVYFKAAAYAAEGVSDKVTLTVEVTGGGEFLDGTKSKTVQVANMNPGAEDVATDMWKDKGHSFYVVSQPGNMLSANTRIRLVNGDYAPAEPHRVFIDDFYLFRVERDDWDSLIGGLQWVEDEEKAKAESAVK